MLVLTRRLGERVVIEGGVEVTVVSIQGDKIGLGFTAPDHIRIDRQEIHERRCEFSLSPRMH